MKCKIKCKFCESILSHCFVIHAFARFLFLTTLVMMFTSLLQLPCFIIVPPVMECASDAEEKKCGKLVWSTKRSLGKAERIF